LAFAAVVVLLVAAFVALRSCSGPSQTPPLRAAATLRVPPSRPAEKAEITQVTLLYRSPAKTDAKRSHDEAMALAERIAERSEAARRWSRWSPSSRRPRRDGQVYNSGRCRSPEGAADMRFVEDAISRRRSATCA